MEKFRVKMADGESVRIESTIEKLVMLFENGIIQRAWHEDGTEVVAWMS